MTSTLHRRQDLIDEEDAFLQKDATHKEVASAGIQCPAALYDEDTHDSLHDLTPVQGCLSARLPPTEDAAAQLPHIPPGADMIGVDKETTDWGWT